MAQLSDLPASAPPTAPEREATGQLMLRGYATIIFLAVFGHTAIYNLGGMIGAVIAMTVLTLATLAIGIPLLVRRRPAPFLWRRLPWTALGYVGFALLSVAWSFWRGPTMLTWLLLAAVTLNALFIAHALSWQEIARSLASAMKWLLGLSLALELWVALIRRAPLLPLFFDRPDGELDPQWYWVRGNLFDGGRLQGIVGNANVLAIVCLFALIVFGVRFATRPRWRATLAVWMLVAAFLFVRAGSATAMACAAAALVVLVLALLIRRAAGPGARRRLYLICGGAVVVVVVAVWLLRDRLLALLGRASDLTGRTDLIWSAVLERVGRSPIVGNGFSSPWVPSHPAFDGWIIDHGITVFHAHDMWLDVLLQLGVVGVVLMVIICLSLLWRAWFFAVDRPRWDLRDDRPFSPLSLLPILCIVVLLVQGLVESSPIMLWGWLLIVMFSFKIKSVPLIGVGLSEQARVTERGHKPRRVP